MNLSERLNVLIQAITLSQKNGGLDLNTAVSAKYSIDVISSGVLNETFTSAINTLIEIIISSQKKGIYSLKDAHMIYVAIEGIENELQNEINRLSGVVNVEKNVENKTQEESHVLEYNTDKGSKENVISISPKKLKRI